MYESDTSTVTDALHSSNPTVFSTNTINQILALSTKDNATVRFDMAVPDADGNVTVASGAEVVLISSSDTQQTTLTPPSSAPVIIFQGKGGIITTLNDGVTTVPSSDQTQVDRIVVGSSGNDRITVADARNTKLILGSGDSTITTGHGVDTVEAGLGNSTIVGGSGDYAVVKMGGNASNYQVTVNNGHAVVTDQTTHKTTDISKIQYVQLDNNRSMVFAKDALDAAVSTLYHTAYGRDGEASGMNYWFDLAHAGASLRQIAESFTHTPEFAALAALSDTDFVSGLYQNSFGRAGEADGIAFWTDSLAHGLTRGELIEAFAQIGANNIAGSIHTEAQVIGQVTIVTGIL